MSAPALNIPASDHCVNVSIIDTGARIRAPTSFFIANPLPGHETLNAVAYVFLIEHEPTGQKVLFDLGIRKNWQALPPAVTKLLRDDNGFKIEVDDDPAGVLKRDGRVNLEDVNAIIWSHAHLDHVGDPSTFPPTTDLVIGPGIKSAHFPGYPKDPTSQLLETDFEGRKVRELNFGEELKLGRFKALDYFGDGSFYLLETPGHTVGHITALARTTPSTFIFMGADTCHHGGSLRPSKHVPLPDSLSPSPLSVPPYLPGSMCPGSLLQGIHRHHHHDNPDESFYPHLSQAPDRNLEQAEESIRKMAEFDASDDVLVIFAHDTTLIDVVEVFPQKANGWKVKGWKEEGKWRFLQDFKQVADAVKDRI